MNIRRSTLTALAMCLVLAAATHVSLSAETLTAGFCPLALDIERTDLADLELEAALARSRFAAYEQIYRLIEGLWQANGIDRMSYLKAKHDYDSARLTLERNDMLVARQAATVEQLRLMCGESADAAKPAEPRSALETAWDSYRRADCAQQAKAIEVAEVNLDFDRAYLASVVDLRSGRVATRQDVILAELRVAEQEVRLADAKRRTGACRSALPRASGDQAPSGSASSSE